jgi:hypothetical protein
MVLIDSVERLRGRPRFRAGNLKRMTSARHRNDPAGPWKGTAKPLLCLRTTLVAACFVAKPAPAVCSAFEESLALPGLYPQRGDWSRTSVNRNYR